MEIFVLMESLISAITFFKNFLEVNVSEFDDYNSVG